jgi:hypothetical protein
MITKAALLDAFTEEIKMDPQRRVNSEALITRNLNAAQKRVQADANYRMPDQQSVLNFTVAGEYVLPADFLGVADPSSVRINGNLVEAADYNDLLGRYGDLGATGGATYYYIRKENGDNIFGTYPQDNASVVMPYLRELPEITNSQDSVLPEKYMNAIVYYAIYLTLKRIRGYEQKAMEYMNYYQEAISQDLVIDLAQNRHALKFGSPRGRMRNYKWF